MKAIECETALNREIERMQPQVIELIRTLCAIPAPSHHEERRAAFVRQWFEQHGMEAEIDEALNVRCPVGLDRHEDMVVVMAHMDTVFPDREPMPFEEKDGRLYCPGVGDNTANLAAMMMLASALKAQRYEPVCGVLFVANSCEEGLGNLKGCRAIMKAYGPRVKAFLALDGGSDSVCARAVGSSRYRIRVETKGGHSFADFGSRSAIETACRLVSALYDQAVPRAGTSTTTYNVGMISGGTSINAIAQRAEMLYEYRSDSAACLEIMERQMRSVLEACACAEAKIGVELLGTRPCAGYGDPDAQRALENACLNALALYTGERPGLSSGSTDCNIPLSMGIPSACFGVYRGAGEHTREEWIDPSTICAGMKAAASVLMNWFQKPACD
ncbi:MAG TPA: M20/M25/M40 family metallo-hydrolase [Candidatus Ventricola intestinavium]|nr:M20/M25/M40 family metallo-hydrolase [Candidatus Ventricola intestinavium]